MLSKARYVCNGAYIESPQDHNASTKIISCHLGNNGMSAI